MKHLLLIICLLLGPAISAQTRTSTPVVATSSRPTPPVKEKKTKNNKEEKNKKPERPESVVEITDDNGNSLFLDTISGNEWVDSMALAQPKVIGNIYPLLDAINIGVDIYPAVNRVLGAGYGLGSVWARLSLHNRYFPAVEFGLSNAFDRPEKMNYTYRSPICPYFKIGIDYNFFYNSNPDYQVYATFRYGLTPVKFSLSDITIANSYWGLVESPFFPEQTCWNGFIQLGAGIHVKIFGPIALGWAIKYQRVIHHSAETFGQPWVVPGMGKRNSELGLSFSIIYTIPLHSPIQTE